jgi:hypothetical protein
VKKGAVRLAALVGAAALGLFLCRASPREVVLVYDLADVQGARALDVRIEKAGELYRRADFPSPGAQVRHAMKLPQGIYHVKYAIDRTGGALSGDRPFEVTESQTIVLSLTP